LPLEPDGSKSNKSVTGTQFDPNKIISRREYARWLLPPTIKFMLTVRLSKSIWHLKALNQLSGCTAN
jgi:hypothetical protein